MTNWTGRFLDPAVAETEAHERAQTDAEKKKHLLPQTVTYEVAWEPADKIRTSRKQNTKSSAKGADSPASGQKKNAEEDASRFVLSSMGGNTLKRPIVASITYMDVGCWGGSAPKDENTTAHWKKQRYFGIVYEGLAVLCAYQPWRTGGSKPEPDTNQATTVPSKFDFQKDNVYQKILPLLEKLSTDPKLGPVVVLQVVLNKQSGVESPSDDRIHVILGDLHAPVMTDREATYAGRPHHDPGTGHSTNASNSTGVPQGPASSSSPAVGIGQSTNVDTSTGLGGTSSARILNAGWAVAGDNRTSVGTGLAGNLPTLQPSSPAHDDRRTNVDPGIGGVPHPVRELHPLRGRYERSVVEMALVPILSCVLGKRASIIARQGNVFVKIAEDADVAVGTIVRLPQLLAGTVIGMGNIALATGLDRWSDDDGAPAHVVEDWFDRYHGVGKLAGADVFDDAAADLWAWLKMLETYQGGLRDGHLPIKLIQVGDLFDFWIGLKCPFSLPRGARTFPNPDAAKKFVEFWLGESLKNKAIDALWHFTAAPKVILYGNHDTYMGSPQLMANPLPAQFADKGLLVEHGHKDDPFNGEDSAGLGYLLTQAVFVDNSVRLLEGNMSSVKTMVTGSLWTRLGYNESAVKACVRDRIANGKPIASTFVMGHTHQPILQRIDIVEEYTDPSKRTATDTGLGEPPKVTVRPLGPGESQSTHTSTATGLPENPSTSSSKGKAGGTSSDRRTSIKTRIPVPQETPIPPALQWYKRDK